MSIQGRREYRDIIHVEGLRSLRVRERLKASTEGECGSLVTYLGCLVSELAPSLPTLSEELSYVQLYIGTLGT